MASDFTRGIGPWILGFLGLGIGGAGQFSGQTLGIDSSSFEFFVLFIIIPSLAASLMVAERDQDMLGSLGMTLLSGKDIVLGKIAGVQRIVRPFIWGAVSGRLLVYLGFVLTDLFNGTSLENLDPIPLLYGWAELIICVYVMPRFALQGAASRSGPLATTLASYGYVVLIWMLISICSTIVAVPFITYGAGYAYTGVHSLAKFLILILAARHIVTQTGIVVNQQLRSTV